jgi:hypothetical protein
MNDITLILGKICDQISYFTRAIASLVLKFYCFVKFLFKILCVLHTWKCIATWPPIYQKLVR